VLEGSPLRGPDAAQAYRLHACRRPHLALGIGANTAIFTLVHDILLKSLPVSHPEQLYNLGDDQECCAIGGSQDSFSPYGSLRTIENSKAARRSSIGRSGLTAARL